MTSVGIERLRVYPGTMALDMRTLVEARGGRVDEVCGQMMIEARTVSPPWEDVVTMAVQAGRMVLGPGDRERVRFLIVATESGPDQEKSLSTWVQRYLELPDDVRHLEAKSACYAGTGALQLAAAWIAQWPEPDAAALVITTDQSRQHFGKPWEFVMGGGATALLVSRNPRFMALEPGLSGVFTHEVSDLFRPTSRVEAGHSETSLLSYLDAVDQAFERYLGAVRRLRGRSITSVSALAEWAPHHVYHAPFGGITLRAHRAVLRTLDGFDAHALQSDFERRVAPTLEFGRRMGGVYAGSTFVSLAGLAASGRVAPGERVLVYAYGSGSVAELYSGVLGPAACEDETGLADLLAARRALTVREYEEAERERTAFIDTEAFTTSTDGFGGWYDTAYRGAGRLVFRGARDWVRQYAWS
jgi:3-hydroxy-3-methylglutaryl CoA synthase